MTHKILRLPEVIELTGLSRSTIYARIAENKFPRSYSLGGRAVGWFKHEIDQWFDSLIEDKK